VGTGSSVRGEEWTCARVNDELLNCRRCGRCLSADGPPPSPLSGLYSVQCSTWPHGSVECALASLPVSGIYSGK